MLDKERLKELWEEYMESMRRTGKRGYTFNTIALHVLLTGLFEVLQEDK